MDTNRVDTNKENDFALDDMHVSPSHNEIAVGNKALKVQPKVMAVLLYLARNYTRVVSNEELIERLWEGRIVTHGSVQKSINALRSALAELVGEQEIIAHYSKRGYQLKIEPRFPFLDQPDAQSVKLSNPVYIAARWRLWYGRHSLLWLGLAGGMFVLALLVYSLVKIDSLSINKNHKTIFTAASGYTNETGHERGAEPHPKGNHIAYVREKFNANNISETASELLVRDNQGKDWRIATSQGSWFKLAWSPAGNHLVAVEVKRREDLPPSPDFYEKPNYLYSFHIFSLDLASNRLLEKQLLSQWQGRIYSVTWWDENTLEFVAKQGSTSSSTRYRYATENQQLTSLDEVEGVVNLLASTVQHKKTAIASAHKNSVQIDFLNENQSPISRWQLNFSTVDISWIPDGSGVLVYAEDERKLLALYMDGQQTEIPLTDTKDRIFSQPRYRPDGAAIFYTEEKRSTNILMLGLGGTKTNLTENSDLNYSAAFSPDGEKVVYASVRNNQIHLWLVEGEHERQLTSQPIEKKVNSIIWSENGEHLLYSLDTKLYHYNFLTTKTSLLLSELDKIQPVAYFPDTHRLLIVKNNGDVKNLWRIDLKNQHQKQLTFGSVGAAIEYDGDVFFQYASESGLWVLRSKDDSLEQVAPTLNHNSKLLKVDSNGVYFISGGMCRESDIYYLDFANHIKSTFLARDTNIVSTTSFNIKKGVLQTECYLAESNIVLLE
ncbi:MAG: winged helix-turn-helix domain-containing protein [Pseudomonadota bacterium]